MVMVKLKYFNDKQNGPIPDSGKRIFEIPSIPFICYVSSSHFTSFDKIEYEGHATGESTSSTYWEGV
jgi:hypothetical protein